MRFSTTAVTFGIAVMFCLSWQAGAVEFAPAKAYSVGTNPSGVVVADFNGDGKPDIAVVNSGSNNVSILLGNGDGTFQPAKTFDVGNSMTSIFAGDFNGDGKMDLAVFLPGNSSASTKGEVRILLGNGDGTFQSPVTTTLTVAATVLGVGDFNGDKTADLVLSNVDPGTQAVTLELFLGKGDGTFQPAKSVPSAAQNGNFAVADFNQDGKLDLAIAVAGGVQILEGRGDGTFQPGGTAKISSGYASQTILTGDFNSDGNMDLIVDSREVSCSGGIINRCSGKQNVSVFLGGGDATFGAEQIFAQGGYSGGVFSFNTEVDHIALGDFNGDGKLDIMGHRYFSLKQLQIWLGKGDGTFADAPIAHPSLVTAVADLNGDSLSDLLVADSSSSSVLVLLNASPTSGADLGINGAPVPATVGEGINLTYAAAVLNEGPQDATNVTLSDAFPVGVTFVSATSTKGSCTRSNQTITCTIGELVSGADVQISIVVAPTMPGTITNTMNVSATEPDLVPANNQDTQTSAVVPVYTLTVTKSGTGSGTLTDDQVGLTGPSVNCGSTCSAKYLSGAQVDVLGSPDAGSFFQAWGGACSGNTSCAVTMNADTTVSATFVKGATLTLTVAGSGSGTVTSSDTAILCGSGGTACSSLYMPGTSVSLKAAPSGNSVFGGWSGACSGTDPSNCTLTLNADESVTATFNPPPDFTVAAALSSLTLKAGSTVSEALSFAAQGGFSAPIALSCAVNGTAPTPTCSISPNSVNPGSNATLTVDASGLSAMTFPYGPWQMPNTYALCLALTALVFLLTGTLHQQRRRAWLLAATVLVLSVFPAACGGGSSSQPPPAPKTYTVAVTATSGSIQHSTTINVMVN